jgi:hypothetical protein
MFGVKAGPETCGISIQGGFDQMACPPETHWVMPESPARGPENRQPELLNQTADTLLREC